MLAMHYAIRLEGQEAVQAVRRRAAERGPLFDNMPGLAHKLFLVDPKIPCYATFYLWYDPDAALDFLEGDFFAALSQTFGRPDVFLLLSRATDLPFAAGDAVGLHYGQPSGIIRSMDPRNGATISVSEEGKGGRRFEVMYHAIGADPGRLGK